MPDTVSLDTDALALFNQLAWAVGRVEGVESTYFYYSDLLWDTQRLYCDLAVGQTGYVLVRDGGTHCVLNWNGVVAMRDATKWRALLTVTRGRWNYFTVRSYDPALPIDTAA